jgi:hypothetical protein
MARVFPDRNEPLGIDVRVQSAFNKNAAAIGRRLGHNPLHAQLAARVQLICFGVKMVGAQQVLAAPTVIDH